MFGGNCGKSACEWPHSCAEKSGLRLVPRGGPSRRYFGAPPPSLGVAFLQPLTTWHGQLSGQLRGSWHCETAGRHGTELNLLGTGEKLTRP